MSNDYTTEKPDSKNTFNTPQCECPCNPAQITWNHDNASYDEHQHVIPGTCQACGTNLEYVYNEAGIRNHNHEYIHEF